MFLRWKDSTRQIEVWQNKPGRWSWRTRSTLGGEITSWWGEDTKEKSNAVRQARFEGKETGRKVVILDS